MPLSSGLRGLRAAGRWRVDRGPAYGSASPNEGYYLEFVAFGQLRCRVVRPADDPLVEFDRHPPRFERKPVEQVGHAERPVLVAILTVYPYPHLTLRRAIPAGVDYAPPAAAGQAARPKAVLQAGPAVLYNAAVNHEMPEIERRKTRTVPLGSLTIGGGAPITVQSMTNTRTADAEATIAQIERLARAGADIVRVAVPTRQDTAALAEIIDHSPVPIVADVHFHFQRALEAIEAGAAKIRLNPGNIDDRDQVRQVISAAAAAGVAVRVGVNEGSVIDRRPGQRRDDQLARPLDRLMVDKLADYVELFEKEGFANLVLAAKSHDALTCVAANRLISQRWDYPLHLGVTHAGVPETASIRSAAAIGALLCEGIGDTIRISYAGDPVEEVRAGVELLCSLRLRRRKGVELIACPTCGRLQMDLGPMVEQVRSALADIEAPIVVAMMGCTVNGPGEADGADVAICAGKDKAVLYSAGRRIRTVPADSIVQTVVAEARKVAAERSDISGD